MAEEPLLMYQGNLSPGVVDTLRMNNQLYDLTGIPVNFMMRPEDSSTVTVDGIATVDPDQVNHRGQVRYQWVQGDTDVAGEYFAWWRLSTAEGPLDLAEFKVIVDQHAPGVDARTGAIAEYTNWYLPYTIDALRGYPSFGDEGMQATIDLVKESLFGVVVPPDQEIVAYPKRVLDYVAKIVTIAIILKAIDYWNGQPTSVTTTGTNESMHFPLRHDQLWLVRKQLIASVQKYQVVQNPDGSWSLQLYQGGGFPIVKNTEPCFVTPDPAKWPKLARKDLYVGWRPPWLVPWEAS